MPRPLTPLSRWRLRASRRAKQLSLIAGLSTTVAIVAATLIPGTLPATAAQVPSFRSTVPSLPSAGAALLGKTSSSATPTALTTTGNEDSTDTLLVSADPASIANYWYWADGVTVTVTGVYGAQPVHIEDVSPSGGTEVFDPVQPTADGRATIKVKSAKYLPEVGVHTLIATSDDGASGRATLTVSDYRARPLRVSVSPATIDRHAWPTHPVTVTASGFSAHERVTVDAFQPDGTGQSVGANSGLRANAAGTFTYQLQPGSAASQFGTWGISVGDSSNSLSGYASTEFTVTEGVPSRAIGNTAVSPAHVAPSKLAETGVNYTLTGLQPWDVAVVMLRTPRGIDYPIGKFRASASGRIAGGVVATAAGDAGTYTVTATSIRSANSTSGTFEVTPDSEHPVVRPTAAVASKISQLALLDEAVGLRVSAAGFDPDAATRVRLISRTQAVLPWSSRTIAARTTTGSGTAEFRLASRSTVPAGQYVLQLVQDNANPIVLRVPITVQK